MGWPNRRQLTSWLLVLTLVLPGRIAADRLLEGVRVADTTDKSGEVLRRCLTPAGNYQKLGGERTRPYRLPMEALDAHYDTTIHCLILRYDFQYEVTDDPNTTGRGQMDLRPIASLPDDQILDSLGHFVDPPPHSAPYFDQHMQSLARYWEQVSEGKVHLTWDIYPPGDDSVYTLPQPMNYYGRCSFEEVNLGLILYTEDCFALADTAHLIDPAHPDINFADYGAFFLFHAGSDRQNDIGFPETCSDMFTGFVNLAYDERYGLDERIPVDNGAFMIPGALLMPETSIQDGRVTALNAVLAHEFGHQVGLPDLYSTLTFRTQLGDFALMDNNGFSTGIEFPSFDVFKVFGVMPLYPTAWSRAFLGFVEVEDFRRDTTGVRLVAAELAADSSLKIARIPISEKEYYLLENRIPDTDGKTTHLRFNRETSVIMGPYALGLGDTTFTGEFDFMLPGDDAGGLLIFHVDEAVAEANYSDIAIITNGGADTVPIVSNNFMDNHLQWWLPGQERKFIEIIEADGFVNFGGYYSSGHGRPEDMYRDDRATAFTPNTNPPSIDNSGNNTHIRITNIGRGFRPGTSPPQRDDREIFFDLEIDKKTPGFPVRTGSPLLGLSPIVDDLNADGRDEILVASRNLLSVFTGEGENFIRSLGNCDTLLCPLYYDTAANFLDTVTAINSSGNVFDHAPQYPVPVFAETPFPIISGPVTGTFADDPTKLIAVGYADGRLWPAWVTLYQPTDLDDDARGDSVTSFRVKGPPIAISFGEVLWVLTLDGWVYRKTSSADPIEINTGRFIPHDDYFGICRLGDRLVLIGGDSATTDLHVVDDTTVYTYTLDGFYLYGPVLADLNRDGMPEVVLFTPEGDGVYVTIDTTSMSPQFTILAQATTGHEITVNPTIGDVDSDGYPDVIVAGRGEVYAFDYRLVSKTDFPLAVDSRFPDSVAIAAVISSDIAGGSGAELIFPTAVGNFYSYGPERTFGFPLSSGEQIRYESGSPAVVYFDSLSQGNLGYQGGDGWFYSWQVEADGAGNLWPMNGSDPAGTFAADLTRFVSPSGSDAAFTDEKYYNYPNPVRGDQTTIRYFLGESATSVALSIYDLSGVQVASLTGDTEGGLDHEVIWQCADITPGVYRCVISIDFANQTETAFTDIAIVR